MIDNTGKSGKVFCCCRVIQNWLLLENDCNGVKMMEIL